MRALATGLAAALVALAQPSDGAAQEPLRATMLGEARVGRDAPDFTLPYFTSAGPGPADQPFHLRAELGRRVVLVFAATAADGAVAAIWERLAADGGRLLGEAVVVGVFQEAPSAVEAWAVASGGPFKVVADSAGRVSRSYGVTGGARVHVYVVGDDGRVVYRNQRFQPDEERAWLEIGRHARGG